MITEELQRRGIHLPQEEELITKRVIHTTADFEYADTLTYADGAIQTARDLLMQGANIVTDTNMTLAGINKRALGRFGGRVHCFMAEDEIARLAKERGETRAAVSMERASGMKGPLIFAIGNAPTALIRLYELMQEKNWRPDFVIGVPVGFVNVEAAKELMMETDVPYIVNRGRKGGSTVAAAICNALLYGMEKERS